MADPKRFKRFIVLTAAEVQSGLDRVRWAEGLIRQLPETHEGRNSWLLNYAGEKNVVQTFEPTVSPSAPAPDAYCHTLPDGTCDSTDPRDMHNLAPAVASEPDEAEMDRIFDEATAGMPGGPKAPRVYAFGRAMYRFGLSRAPAPQEDGWRPIETLDLNHHFAHSKWVQVATDTGRVTDGLPFTDERGWLWILARGANCADPRHPQPMLREKVTHYRPLPAPPGERQREGGE